MKLLPLGTVIKANDHKVCIVGYTSVEKDANTTCGYFVVPYPLGFVNIDKVFFIPHYQEVEVLAEGYKTEPSERILDTLSRSFEMIEKVSLEDLEKFNETLKNVVSKKEEAEK